MNSGGFFNTLDEVVIIYGRKVLDVAGCVQDIDI